MKLLPSLLVSLIIAGTSAAQDNPNTILVMDGSGSMWGQIDGVAKITIAQGVVADLLQTIPETQGLGLTVYGHRERGNCADIETVVAPAAGTRDQIIAAVNGITPLGKTPMTDSIIAAAQALRYTEDSATVILVSDGVETCNPDPCAAARLLEEAGIDFTAHVIGFDVGSDAQALEQMQCIADETGGQFLTAENAAELGAALAAVVEEPEAIIATATFEARLDDAGNTLIETPVLWSIAEVFENADGNPLSQDLPAGEYEVTAYWTQGEVEATQAFELGDIAQTINVVFEEPVPTVTLTAPATATVGSEVAVSWVGPNNTYDRIQIVPAGSAAGYVSNDFYTTADGKSEGTLLVPGVTGDYIIRYTLADGSVVVAEQPITITEANITITAADTAPAGAIIPISWTGAPAAPYDQIRVVAVGEASGRNGLYASVDDPAANGMLELPAVPGDYVLLYVTAEDEAVLAEKPLTVTAPIVRLEAPQIVLTGADLTISWIDAPGGWYDTINVTPVAEDVSARGVYFLPRSADGQDTRAAPDVAGEYRLSYVSSATDAVLFEINITVTDDASLIGTTPVNPDAESTTEDAEATGEDEASLTGPGALHGDWKLVATLPDRTVDILVAQVTQASGADLGTGSLVVETGPDWGFGPTGGFGDMTLSMEDPDMWLMTLVVEAGTLVSDLSQTERGWEGELTTGTGATYPVLLVRPHDYYSEQASMFPDGIDHQLMAVDERGEQIEAPVTWSIQSPDMASPDTFQSTGRRTDDVGRAPGAYEVIGTAGDLEGRWTITLGQQQRRANFVVLKPRVEGADLPIDTSFFCAQGESCRMEMADVPINFTLPVGWGATRPIARRGGNAMFTMATMTDAGPFHAALNQRHYGAPLETCYDLVSGTFCHDATDDPALLADIAILKRTLSFSNAGRAVFGDAYDELLTTLEEAAQ